MKYVTYWIIMLLWIIFPKANDDDFVKSVSFFDHIKKHRALKQIIK